MVVKWWLGGGWVVAGWWLGGYVWFIPVFFVMVVLFSFESWTNSLVVFCGGGEIFKELFISDVVVILR